MFHSRVQRKENLSFSFPLCCCWQDSVRLQLTYETHWANFSKSLYTLHVLDFSCIATALGGGRACGVQGRVGTDGFFTFATSLWMCKCTNFVRFGFLKSRVPEADLQLQQCRLQVNSSENDQKSVPVSWTVARRWCSVWNRNCPSGSSRVSCGVCGLGASTGHVMPFS